MRLAREGKFCEEVGAARVLRAVQRLQLRLPVAPLDVRGAHVGLAEVLRGVRQASRGRRTAKQRRTPGAHEHCGQSEYS